jgi:hypothetical protein
LDIEISNVIPALTNLTSRGAVDPVIKVTLLLSESGLVSVHDAVAYGQIRDDTLTGDSIGDDTLMLGADRLTRQAENLVRWGVHVFLGELVIGR